MGTRQFSLRTFMLFLAGVAVLLVALLEVNGRIDDLTKNGYRVQATGDLLVDYMKACGKWPNGWEDLRRFVQDHKTELRYTPDLKDLQSNVRVDFDFNPAKIDLRSEWSETKPPLVVVTSRYGRTWGATRNPNQHIYAYLRDEAQLQD